MIPTFKRGVAVGMAPEELEMEWRPEGGWGLVDLCPDDHGLGTCSLGGLSWGLGTPMNRKEPLAWLSAVH